MTIHRESVAPDGRQGRLIAPCTMLCLATWLATQLPGFLIAAFLLPAILAVTIDRRPHRQRADRDPLTGLDRRASLIAALAAGTEEAARRREETACLVFEIDNFRSFEARLDREALDTLLRLTARRLVAALRDSDTCVRLDGPVFAVALGVMPRLGQPDAERLAQRLQDLLSLPLRIGEEDLRPSLSAGFARAAGVSPLTPEGLLQAATLALIEGQRRGPGTIRAYDHAMQARNRARQRHGRDVGRALENGEIRPFFQPQLCLAIGRVTGAEALARWHRPDGVTVPPVDFLSALEGAGRMRELGAQILDGALAALSDWDARDLGIDRVGVNFSAEELRQADLVDRVGFALGRYGLDPGRLSVEVLETVVAGRPDDTVAANLHGLARLGCRIDLDDFGTGHASITSIRRFPVNRLKIDRSFVRGIDRDMTQRRIVGAILTMADRLELEALAEGVETPGELETIREMGCGHLQGFVLARPMAAADFAAWLAAPRGESPGVPMAQHLRIG
ncbi:putative bifunctional diguanylate cyclase/phosphodiesterase [Histidinibacterium lentulum]|nr:bifunctional diguanylate cyclase/phosphodiesterase [Histidinibacterium lentulum]